jgi:hypothetical protein
MEKIKEARRQKDEHYVLDLCDKILDIKSLRQHRFDFLVGDTNSRGSAVRLPVDAYYDKLKLVIEYRERQHTDDEKRRNLIPKNGLLLVEISYSDFNHDKQKRIIRSEKYDMGIIKKILSREKISLSNEIKDYGNDPFFVKKAEESKAFLESNGFPL